MGTGGSRYGAGRPGWRRKCEHSMAFDIRQLAMRGLLKPGNHFSWSWNRDGEPVGSVTVHVDECRILLSYSRTVNSESRQDQCVLSFEECAGGYGSRRMIACPRCGKRCQVVYFGGNGWACRKCLKLVYLSEAEDSMGRLWRKQLKIEARLENDGSYIMKPKGMHQRTFDCLVDKIDHVEDQKDATLLMRLAPLARRWGWKIPIL